MNVMKVMKLSNQTSKVTGKYKTPEPLVRLKVCSSFQGFCLLFFSMDLNHNSIFYVIFYVTNLGSKMLY